jgi:hypothetical protein
MAPAELTAATRVKPPTSIGQNVRLEKLYLLICFLQQIQKCCRCCTQKTASGVQKPSKPTRLIGPRLSTSLSADSARLWRRVEDEFTIISSANRSTSAGAKGVYRTRVSAVRRVRCDDGNARRGRGGRRRTAAALCYVMSSVAAAGRRTHCVLVCDVTVPSPACHLARARVGPTPQSALCTSQRHRVVFAGHVVRLLALRVVQRVCLL